MKVFIAGATGVLGRRLVERLSERGHEVHGLARDDAGERAVERRGGTARRGDVLEPESLERALDSGVDAVVHAATKIPTSTKPSDEDWEANDRVRLDGARNLLAAAEGIDQFLFPSVVMVARQPDGSEFDEDSERHADRATRTAAEVEDQLRERASEEGFEATILRFGLFYAPDAADTRAWARRVLSGDVPIVGGGLLGRRDAELALVHADDAARAATAAIDDGASGCYHVVDDEPVTAATFFRTFAELLAAPAPRRIPGWLARLFVGEVDANALTTPTRTSNDRFCRAVDWEPAFPTHREGLRGVVETWLEDGTLREVDDGYEWCGD